MPSLTARALKAGIATGGANDSSSWFADETARRRRRLMARDSVRLTRDVGAAFARLSESVITHQPSAMTPRTELAVRRD
jgi:hypothetical protein